MLGHMGPGIPEISTQEVAHKLEAQENPFLLDVREVFEYEAGHIPGSLLIPLGNLPERLNELPKDRDLVVICRSGQRSGRAVRLLLEHGYQARNMVGGMLAWKGPVA